MPFRNRTRKKTTPSLSGALACLAVLLSPGQACLYSECSRTDVVCHTGAFVLYTERDCNLTQSLAVGAFQQISYVKASNTEPNDFFGGDIAFDCSTQTLAVGTIGESSSASNGVNGNQSDNSASNAGAVYVFRRSGTNWSQEAYLKASNAGANDNFGRTLALYGNILGVGAPAEASNATGVNGNQSDNSVVGAGAVYLFRNSGTNWSQDFYIKASNPDAGDNFGDGLSLSEGVMAVAASQESSNAIGINGNQADNSASISGAVYVFRRGVSTWTQEAYVKASNTAFTDVFGSAVKISRHILAVGAINDDSNARGINGNDADNSSADSGAAFVYLYENGAWKQTTYLKSSNSDAGDGWGVRMGLSGDVLVISSTGEDGAATGVNGDETSNAATNAGAVYVFK